MITTVDFHRWTLQPLTQVKKSTSTTIQKPPWACSYPKDNLVFDSYCFNVSMPIKFYMHVIIQNIYFWVAFSFPCYVYGVYLSYCTYSLFFFIAVWYSTVWICHSVPDNSTADGCLSCFQWRTITNSATGSSLVHDLQCTCMRPFVVYIHKWNC